MVIASMVKLLPVGRKNSDVACQLQCFVVECSYMIKKGTGMCRVEG